MRIRVVQYNCTYTVLLTVAINCHAIFKFTLSASSSALLHAPVKRKSTWKNRFLFRGADKKIKSCTNRTKELRHRLSNEINFRTTIFCFCKFQTFKASNRILGYFSRNFSIRWRKPDKNGYFTTMYISRQLAETTKICFEQPVEIRLTRWENFMSCSVGIFVWRTTKSRPHFGSVQKIGNDLTDAVTEIIIRIQTCLGIHIESKKMGKTNFQNMCRSIKKLISTSTCEMKNTWVEKFSLSTSMATGNTISLVKQKTNTRLRHL